MQRTFTYTVKVSKQTHINLESFFEQQRLIWNAGLEERISAWQKEQKSISFFEQVNSLTEIRQDEEFSKYFRHAQTSILTRLNKAFHNFFKRVNQGQSPGFPRFKGVNRQIKSFESFRFKIHSKNKYNSVSIKGIGKFKFKGSIKGNPKQLRIVKTPIRIKLQLVCELPEPTQSELKNPIGIDVGIKNRITCSDGTMIDKNAIDRTELKKRQRVLANSKKGSNNYKKKCLSLQKEWQRITEHETGKIHELTSELVKKTNQFSVENLNIGNLVKNKNLSRSIMEQSWGKFIQMLSYKAESAGGKVIKVNPKNTSQVCSSCGGMPDEPIGLDTRVYICYHCGYVENRDINAAKNILRIGYDSLAGWADMQASKKIVGTLVPAIA